ncbi:MAG: hypothetical protein HY922_01900 [Elusimicrobia bacterium]|nr:hypothetical protein [Elusimicrobiota bacterium]
MWILLSLWFLIAAAAEARAGLSFVQVIEAQTSGGQDGLFGKSWVELSGGKMRIVSGYARKLGPGGEAEEPQRIIQLIDLSKRERLLLWPETKSFARVPLGAVDYAAGLEAKLRRGAPDGKIELQGLEARRTSGRRRLLGAECVHYRLYAEMTVEQAGGRKLPARMRQDVWVVPVSSRLAQPFLDLAAFENAYRGATGGALSPIDYERYQVREAAAHLRVPPAQVQAVVEKARGRLRELDGYPAASSVAWWLGEVSTEAAHPMAESPKSPPRQKPSFRVIDWHRSERDINRMYEKTRSEFGAFPMGSILSREAPRVEGAPPTAYPAARDDLHRELILLLGQLAEEERAAAPAGKGVPKGPPYYQIYAQLHGLEASRAVPEKDLSLPAGYKERKTP